MNADAGSAFPGAEAAPHLARVEWLADLLDSRFRIPGTPWRFGIDAILGLIPGIGDALAFTIAAAIVAYGAALGVQPAILLRMAGNIAVDFIVGSIPVIGDIFDVAFKANRRNLALLRRAL